MNEPVKPLEGGSRNQVNEVLDSIAEVMNAVSVHYRESGTHYRFDGNPGGAVSLLYVLDDGIRAEAKRRERLLSRTMSEDDYAPRDL